MRTVLLALLVAAPLLAGCGQPVTQGTTTPFEQSCPAWIGTRNTFGIRDVFEANSTLTTIVDPDSGKPGFGSGLLADENRPLDIVVLDFTPQPSGNSTTRQFVYVHDGALTLTVRRDDDGTRLKIYDPAKGPRGLQNPGEDSVVFFPRADGQAQENFQLQVDLADPHDSPRPTSVKATWVFTRDSDQNPATPSQAIMYYTAHYLYRQC